MTTAPSESFRILIVDDDTGTIRILAEMLKNLGEVFFANNGEAGLAMVKTHRPDLILLDIEMPGTPGFDVCAAIKADPANDDLPVLFVTAHSDTASEIRALTSGAVDFLTKPLVSQIVQARVKTHLILKQRTDQLRRLVSIDGLTGVANRRAFDDALAAEWQRAQRNATSLGVVMIDIDHFKRFNDRYGHQTGDDCIRKVAQAVASVVRRPGEVVARYGGEEFAVILPLSGMAETGKLAKLMREKVAALEIPHEASDAGPHVSISIGGTAAIIQSGIAPALLVKTADEALYQAKKEGRNRAVIRATA